MTQVIAGRYVLVDRIGEGATSAVWRAWDRRRHRWVAVKLLTSYDEPGLRRFVHEQALRISHPHVAAPTAWAADDDGVVLVLDLVGGGTADRLLADHGRLPEPYVAVLLDQLLQALDAVHAAGLVHRDVKPANLLLEATGPRRPCLRLGDLGVAVRSGTSRVEIVGTAGYVAPEHAAGAAADPRQDLYAAGVVAVELLTGRPPSGRRRAPPGALRPLLESLTDPDPQRRPASAAAASSWLRSIGVPTGTPWRSQPRPPDVPDRLGRARVPRRRTTWLAVAALVTASDGAGALLDRLLG